jgi:molecular chaperone GrpE
MTDQRPDDTAQAPAPAEHEPTGPQGVVDEPTADAVVQTPGTDDVDADAETAAQAPRDDESEDAPDWEALASDDPRSRGELLAELTEAEARRDEYLDDVRRARAEFENYRRRMLREAQQMRSAGAADLAAGLLDVLDDFDRTLDAAEQSEDAGLAKGVEMVYGKLVEVLRNAGLARVDETGVTFDPERHEAVQQVPADEPRDEPVVAEVLRPGYEIAGRVIRAAMVAVEQ